MANLDSKTRREQILAVLVDNADQWVDGSRLATAEVGGSEGLRRLRELVADGHPIDKRRHPDPRRDIWQYRYRANRNTGPISEAITQTDVGFTYIEPRPTLVTVPSVEPGELGPRFVKLPKLDFGSVAVCPRCKGRTRRYFYPGLEDQRHKDPYKEKRPCLRCSGWGIVPNQGPIPMTPPDGLSS